MSILVCFDEVLDFQEFRHALWEWEQKYTIDERTQIGYFQAFHEAFHTIAPGCTPPDTPPCEEGCSEYPTNHPDVLFFPNNPNTPTDTPRYWRLATEIDTWVGLGLQMGDAGVSFDPIQLADMLLNNRWPNATMRVFGAGVMEVHLVAVPLGGMAKIEVVGQAGARWVDLSVDIELESVLDGISDLTGTELGGDAVYQQVIVEIPVTGTTWNQVKVTIYPKVSRERIPVGMGGVIRQFVWCGEDSEPAPCVPDEPELRIENDCVEWLNPSTQEWECRIEIPPCPPPAPCPVPTVRIGANCVEWMNPATNKWECIADLPPGGADCGLCSDDDDCLDSADCGDCEEC